MATQTHCRRCGKTIDPLEVFPGGICVDCYAKTPEGRRMPTAEELTAMWGGRRGGRRRTRLLGRTSDRAARRAGRR